MKRIINISISGSPFFDDIKIDFSNKLNCIMGGRGAGKTTLLYFLLASIDKDAENYQHVYSILKSNLEEGRIEIEYEDLNGNILKVIKTLNDFPTVYSNDVLVAFDSVKSALKCDFYEAQAIEEIGRNGISRLQLLDKKIYDEVHTLKHDIKTIQIQADGSSQDIRNINLRIQQKNEILKSFENVEEQFENHKKIKPSGLSDAERNEFETADKLEKVRGAEDRYAESIVQNIQNFHLTATNFKSSITDYLTKTIQPIVAGGGNSIINREEINHIILPVEKSLEEIGKIQDEIIKNLSVLIPTVGTTVQKLTDKHSIQQAEFVKLKQKFETNKAFIDTYNKLSKQVDDKKNITAEITELIEKQKLIKSNRSQLIQSLNNKKQEIFSKRLNCASEMNKAFKGSIIINLSFGGLKDEFEELLRESLRGSGLRYNELIPKIVKNFSPDQFAKIIHENDIESLRLISGIDSVRGKALIDSLYETDNIYKIETIYTPDLPDFLLRVTTDKNVVSDNYRKSDILSMGQRCTAVLPIVFAVSDNPLIIDQPEDNLDNKYISENIHEIIREQKSSRQLIFITHNPNIPVLSDAEKNIFLSFDKKSSIENEGTVDFVKESIISLLEGGREAFNIRKATYGN